MKVKIRTKGMRFTMPVPVSMIGLIIKFMPDKVLEELRENKPEPYTALITKENISMLMRECLDVLKENKGLEMIHVEVGDGTFVSVRL